MLLRTKKTGELLSPPVRKITQKKYSMMKVLSQFPIEHGERPI